MFKCKFFVIDTQEMQHGCLKIVYMHRVFDDVVTKIICLSISHTRLDACAQATAAALATAVARTPARRAALGAHGFADGGIDIGLSGQWIVGHGKPAEITQEAKALGIDAKAGDVLVPRGTRIDAVARAAAIATSWVESTSWK